MAGQLTGLHAKFTGDSSNFTRAAQRAALEANKLAHKMSQAKKEAEAFAASGAGIAKEFAKLKMETDHVYAGLVRYQKAAALTTKVAEQQQWSHEQLNSELQRLAMHYGIAEQAGYSLNDQVRTSRFHTANLAAQFNDIGVMMASGQSPFILGIQQGTQLTQVLQDMGGGPVNSLKALGGAFLSVVSPLSLLTIGLVAGVAYLYQWATASEEAEGKTKSLSDVVGTLGGSLDAFSSRTELATTKTKELREEFGIYAEEVRVHAAWLAQVELGQAFDDANAVASKLTETLSAFPQLLADMARWQEQMASMKASGVLDLSTVEIEIENIKDILDEAASSMGLTVEQATRMLELFNKLSEEDLSLAEMQVAVSNILGYMQQIQREGEQLPEPLRETARTMEELYRKLVKATTAAGQLAEAGPKAGWLSSAIGETNMLIGRLIAAKAAKDKLSAAAAGPAFERSGKNGSNAPPGIPDVKTIDDYITDGAGAGGGGGGGADPLSNLKSDLERLQEEFKTKVQLEAEHYAERQKLLEDALKNKLLTQQEYAALMEQVERTHQFAMSSETRDGVSATLTALGQLFQGSKKIGAAIAVANSWLAFTEVLKDPSFAGRPWARFAAAASALSAGLNAVRNIKSAQPGSAGGGGGAGGGSGGGSGGGGAPQTSTAVSLQLVGGDMFSRPQVIQLINKINEALNDGARITLR